MRKVRKTEIETYIVALHALKKTSIAVSILANETGRKDRNRSYAQIDRFTQYASRDKIVLMKCYLRRGHDLKKIDNVERGEHWVWFDFLTKN